MAGTILWNSGSVISGFASQLSGQGAQLTTGSCVQLSGDLYNNGVSGGPAFFLHAEFLGAQSGYGANVQSQKNIDLYLVPAWDGTNFPNVDAANASIPANYFKGSFLTAKSGNQQDRMALEGVPLLPLRYRSYIINNTGQTLTSGWTVFMNTYIEAYT